MAKNVTIYYYVKVWLIIVHNYVIFNVFQVIQKLKNSKNASYCVSNF